jgi:hypothetical protein
MVKRLLVLLFILSSTNLFGQIKIAPVEFLWVKRVDSALTIIKTYDKSAYDTLTKYCTNIGFWNGKFSSIDGINEILITKNDVLSGSLNNIAAVIVHESKHLQYVNNNILIPLSVEEIECFTYEKNFLLKIPNVELWLINNTEKEIKRFQRN